MTSLSTVPGFDAAFDIFLKGVQEKSNGFYTGRDGFQPKIDYIVGPKYIKVVRCGRDGKPESSYCYVDRTNGDMLKGSWKGPVKNGVRGNILMPGNALDRVNWHGPNYLRGGV